MSFMRKPNGEQPAATYIGAAQFEVIHFFDKELKREIVILYALGEDGVIREFTNGKWTPFPIQDAPAARATTPTI
jgi:hypothetical protein